MGKPLFGSWGLVLLVSVAGCAPPITIIRQATPNPFRGSATFALLPLDYSGLTIDGMPPQVWLAQSGRDSGALGSDLEGAQPLFAQGVANVAGSAIVPSGHQFLVHTHVGTWSRGYYNYFTNPPTIVSFAVQLTTLEGAVLDEIHITCRAAHSLFRPTPVQGFRVATQECGEQLGGYLQQRRVALLRRARALASRQAGASNL